MNLASIHRRPFKSGSNQRGQWLHQCKFYTGKTTQTCDVITSNLTDLPNSHTTARTLQTFCKKAMINSDFRQSMKKLTNDFFFRIRKMREPTLLHKVSCYHCCAFDCFIDWLIGVFRLVWKYLRHIKKILNMCKQSHLNKLFYWKNTKNAYEIFFCICLSFFLLVFSYKSRTQTEHGCRSLGDGLARKHPRHCDVDQYHGWHEGIFVLCSFRKYFTLMDAWKACMNVGCLIIFVVTLRLKN